MAKRRCLFPGCTEIAINSHLLQKRGILDNLAVDGHLFIVDTMSPFNMELEKLPLEFRRVGLKEVLALPLFCNKHDTELFTDIEVGTVDHFDYRTQILFTYRSLAGELRKKEISADLLGAMMNDSEVRILMPGHLIYKTEVKLQGFLLGISDINWYLHEIEEYLSSPGVKNFTFITREMKQLDVCASAGFTPMDFQQILDPIQELPLSSLSVNIVPRKKLCYLIVGTHNHMITPWISGFMGGCDAADDAEMENIISNILLKRCETWAMSPRLYDKLRREDRERILEELHMDVMSHDQNLFTSFNIFK